MALNPLQAGAFVLGRYKVVQLVPKKSGFARVYEAREANIPVALKELIPDTDPGIARLEIDQFKKEASFLRRVSHPNVAKYIDFGQELGRYFLVIEWLPGGDLVDYKKKMGCVAEKDSVRIGLQIFAGISACHKARFIHKDIKPGNILSDGRGTFKLVDPGIGKDIGQPTNRAVRGAYTAFFAPPEQIAGTGTTEASDIYLAAATIVWLLAPPSYSLAQLSAQVKPDVAPARLQRVCAISPSLAAVLAKGMAVNPKDRWASADQFAKALSNPSVSPNWAAPKFSSNFAPRRKFAIGGVWLWLKHRGWPEKVGIAALAGCLLLIAFINMGWEALKNEASHSKQGAIVMPYGGDNAAKPPAGTKEPIQRGIPQPPCPRAPKLGMIYHATGVNFRSGPGPDSAVLTRLSHGDAFEVLGMVDGWYQVRLLDDGSVGYVWAGYIRPLSPIGEGATWYSTGSMTAGGWLRDSYGNQKEYLSPDERLVLRPSQSGMIFVLRPDGSAGLVPRALVRVDEW